MPISAVPVLPNWKPLPGRISDNQERWAHESETICPWYREMLEKWLQENTFLTKEEKFQAKSVKKLCSGLSQIFSLVENANSSGIPKEHEEDAAEDYGDAANAARGRSVQRRRARRSLDDRH
jgi:hypothetical protein